MERTGLIFLSIWLILAGSSSFVNVVFFKNPVLHNVLQLLAGIFILIGLWPTF